MPEGPEDASHEECARESGPLGLSDRLRVIKNILGHRETQTHHASVHDAVHDAVELSLLPKVEHEEDDELGSLFDNRRDDRDRDELGPVGTESERKDDAEDRRGDVREENGHGRAPAERKNEHPGRLGLEPVEPERQGDVKRHRHDRGERAPEEAAGSHLELEKQEQKEPAKEATGGGKAGFGRPPISHERVLLITKKR